MSGNHGMGGSASESGLVNHIHQEKKRQLLEERAMDARDMEAMLNQQACVSRKAPPESILNGYAKQIHAQINQIMEVTEMLASSIERVFGEVPAGTAEADQKVPRGDCSLGYLEHSLIELRQRVARVKQLAEVVTRL